MTAEDYYSNGLEQKKLGRIGESRKMLMKCIETDTDGNLARQARHFIITQLPRRAVTLEAEQRNIIGYNQLAKGDNVTARRTFEALIHDFPNFEWPYNNLARLEIAENKLNDAARLLEKVTDMNPYYGNAWYTLAEVRRAQNDVAGCKKCLARLTELQHPAADLPLPEETPAPGTTGI